MVRWGMANEDQQQYPIDLIFDGPPGPDGARFIEAEVDGKSVRIGEWSEDKARGCWVLRIDPPAYLRTCAKFVDELKSERIALASLCITHSDALEVDPERVEAERVEAFLAKAQEQS